MEALQPLGVRFTRVGSNGTAFAAVPSSGVMTFNSTMRLITVSRRLMARCV